MTEKVAIISWGAMADILYATPIVRHIRRMHPDADISWLVRDKFAEVVETNPDIDEVMTYTLPDGYDSRQEAEHVMDRAILDDASMLFHKVYDLQYWPRYSNFFERPQEDFISLRARNAGIDPALITDRRITLEPGLGDRRKVSDFISDHGLEGPLVTINHISYAASPVWSFDNYAKLVTELSKYGVRCVFTGAPHEPIPANVVDARGMPYRQWMALINSSNLWLGLDSGAVALACATSTPIIKLHSPDFPLAKTGIKAMGIRWDDVLELCPAPNPSTLAGIIMERMK
jgi:ADP-heptose:LPS heptosyltransferase